MNWDTPLARLILATAILSVALVALWQAGILFQADSEVISDGDNVVAEAFAADASIETPVSGNRDVGLEAGKVAPDFEFSTFDGERMRLSDFRGRPVFLNFWASWCGPCRAEMPDMMTMLELYGEKGLAVLGVNNGESIERGQSFLDDIDVELTELAYDPSQEIVRRYGVSGMPVSFFIDAEGVITRAVRGQLSYELMNSFVEEAIAGYGTITGQRP